MDKENQKNQRKKNLETRKKAKNPKDQDIETRSLEKKARQQMKEAYDEEEWENWDRYYNH